jgi:hypothetical protein
VQWVGIPEPGVAQLPQHVLVREPRELRHVVDLAGRVELQVDFRHRLVEGAGRIEVEVEADVRVLAVDHVDLGEPGVLALAERVLDQLVRRDRVRRLLLLRRRERAELALHAADVRLVQIQVLDEVDLVAAAANPAREVGELAEPQQVVRLEQRDAVVEIQTFPRLDLVPDRGERIRVRQGRHQLSLSTTAMASDSSSSRYTSPFKLSRAWSA